VPESQRAPGERKGRGGVECKKPLRVYGAARVRERAICELVNHVMRATLPSRLEAMKQGGQQQIP
jgi:hypothetical protein